MYYSHSIIFSCDNVVVIIAIYRKILFLFVLLIAVVSVILNIFCVITIKFNTIVIITIILILS